MPANRVRPRPKSSLAWVGLLALLAGGAAGRPMTADSQLAFGVEMARRGLWQEALFRFEQARRLESSARVLNNVAVAYEALGRFEQALATYREALAIAPGQADLKRNYSQFLEFYQGYQSAPGEAAPAAAPEPEGEPEEEG